MVCQHIAENIGWWRRGELNPRPKVLYKAFYILSLVNLKSYSNSADGQAEVEPVTLDLIDT